ncbi:MAG TPA: hypothetical protein VKD71_02755 [Gemmataceae bacterium]|nr:hypothetical protein [Gemmataceae bacterium]
MYVCIDQHARQNMVSLRGKNGDVLLERQVSTEPDWIRLHPQPVVDMDTRLRDR